MNKTLRKRHLQIWIFWAVLLPAGILAGYLAVPEKVTQDLLQPTGEKPLNIRLKSLEKENFIITLRSNNSRSVYQLEWTGRQSSGLAPSLLYRVAKPEDELIGRVDAGGTFRFSLGTATVGSFRFTVFDIIGKKIIDTINLNP